MPLCCQDGDPQIPGPDPSAIIGQSLILGRPGELAYAAVFCVVVAAFVHAYEEPTLAARYGEQYEAYRNAVPAWGPRLRPRDRR